MKKNAYYKQILSDETLVRQVIKEELQEVKNKFNTPRRTRLAAEAKELDVEDRSPKRTWSSRSPRPATSSAFPVATYRQQKRGGKGMQGVNLKDNDFVEHLFVASTHSYMLFFSTAGKVYRLKVYELPEASRHARGTAIVNLLPCSKGETISAIIATKDFPEDEFLMFGTEQGMVKKTSMSLYDRTRRDGLIAINLKDGDSLIAVAPREAGRESHDGVERRQGHHVGRVRGPRHGSRHHGRARHDGACGREGIGHGGGQARHGAVRHHREGLWQAGRSSASILSTIAAARASSPSR